MTYAVLFLLVALPTATYFAARATLRQRAAHDPDGPRTLQRGCNA